MATIPSITVRTGHRRGGSTRPCAMSLIGVAGAAMALVGTLVVPAIAQTQDGNVLQRDLSRVRTGPGQPAPAASARSAAMPARDPLDEFRLRNAIVTGNAPGGRSFRGDVGYTAPGDFRGTLGSDDTFAFRRDSVPSGAAGLGFRGTESLQYQFSLTSGSTRANPTVSRLGAEPASIGGPSMGSAAPTRALDASGLETRQASGQGAWSTSGANMGTLRSVSAFQSSRLLTPSVVGYRPTFAGLERTSASPLLGVRTVMLGRNALTRDDRSQLAAANAVPTTQASTPAGAATASPAASALSTPGGTSALTPVPSTQVPTTALSLPTPSTSGPGLSSAGPNAPGGTGAGVAGTTGLGAAREATLRADPFDAARDRARSALRDRTPTNAPTVPDAGDAPAADPSANPAVSPSAAPAPVLEDPFEARMAALRAMLDPASRGRTGEAIRPRGTRAEEREARETLTPDELRRREASLTPFAGVDAELLEILSGTGATTDSLILDPASESGIAQQMRRGERLMSEGRYFDAEEQFARVLTFRAGYAPALVGRAHAQLGAGLVLSAALNLREFFASRPESIAMRYTGAALPSRERLLTLVEILRENLDRGVAREDSALLLAYIGHQLDDATIRDDGLRSLRASDLTSPLPDVLSRIWSAKPKPAAP